MHAVVKAAAVDTGLSNRETSTERVGLALDYRSVAFLEKLLHAFIFAGLVSSRSRTGRETELSEASASERVCVKGELMRQRFVFSELVEILQSLARQFSVAVLIVVDFVDKRVDHTQPMSGN